MVESFDLLDEMPFCRFLSIFSYIDTHERNILTPHILPKHEPSLMSEEIKAKPGYIENLNEAKVIFTTLSKASNLKFHTYGNFVYSIVDEAS